MKNQICIRRGNNFFLNGDHQEEYLAESLFPRRDDMDVPLIFFSPAEIKEIKEKGWRSVCYGKISLISFVSAGQKILLNE